MLGGRVLAGGFAVVELEPHAVRASEATESTPKNRNQNVGRDHRIRVSRANCTTSNHEIVFKPIVAQRTDKWKPPRAT